MTLDAFANDLANNGPCSSGFAADGPMFDFYKVSNWKATLAGSPGTGPLATSDVQIQIGSSPSSVYLTVTTPRFAQISTQLVYAFRVTIQIEGPYASQQVQGFGMKTCSLGSMTAAAVFGTGAGIPSSIMLLNGDLAQFAGDKGTVSYNADTLLSLHVNTENYLGCTAATGSYRIILAQ